MQYLSFLGDKITKDKYVSQLTFVPYYILICINKQINLKDKKTQILFFFYKQRSYKYPIFLFSFDLLVVHPTELNHNERKWQ
jgi:hypothetical protein